MKYVFIVLLTILSAFYCRGQDIYILQFNKDFDELLHKQKKLFWEEYLQNHIEGLLQEHKYRKTYKEFLIREISYFKLLTNLGEEDQYAELIHYYDLVQKEKITFSKEMCDPITNTLKRYLQKAFTEYQFNIAVHEHGYSSMSLEEYEERKNFLNYFEGYMDNPLKKTGNIFKKVSH